MDQIGVEVVKLFRVSDTATRITLRIGKHWPEDIDESDGLDCSVVASVVAGLPANPPLLDVQLAALKLARSLIKQQIAALGEAIHQADEEGDG